MEFRILGPVEVWDGDRLITVPGEGQRALLALLLLNANRVLSTEQLIDELWGEQAPGSGAKAVQVRVSDIRRTFQAQGVAEPLIISRAPGYVVELDADQLDLHRFERLTATASEALGRGDPGRAAESLREALELWRGPALAEFQAPFAHAAGLRLEELHLGALEQRIEADLALGRHRELIGELEELIAVHPFRESFRAHLMLALYRSRRQAEALEAYRQARRVLVDELGIEPSQPVQELERAILRQDPGLDPAPAHEGSGRLTPTPQTPSPQRSILVAPYSYSALPRLLRVAAPLTSRRRRELVLVAMVAAGEDLERATAELESAREELAESGTPIRVAAFTSEDRGADLARLAAEQDTDLILLDAPPTLLETGAPPADLEIVWRQAPCDVAVLVAGEDVRDAPVGDRPVVIPFGGGSHEWGALEVGAWIAASHGVALQLLGAAERPGSGKRDASRLLAGVSLVVQRSVGVTARPLLVPPGEASVLAATKDAGLLVLGLSERWSGEGLGATRLALTKGARPTLLVRRGVRPGGLAPPERLTRYTWSLADSGEQQGQSPRSA